MSDTSIVIQSIVKNINLHWNSFIGNHFQFILIGNYKNANIANLLCREKSSAKTLILF